MITETQRNCKHEWYPETDFVRKHCVKCDVIWIKWDAYQEGVNKTNAEWLARIDTEQKRLSEARIKNDYSSLSERDGDVDCSEGCGDEGLYHQGQILEGLKHEKEKV